jgi:hypothetical protein
MGRIVGCGWHLSGSAISILWVALISPLRDSRTTRRGPLAFAVFLIACVSSYSGWPHNAWAELPVRPSVCPDDDGASGASPGPPQYPHLLSGYAATIDGPKGLGCKVAGVDYRVGVPAHQVLRDPANGDLPPGCRFSNHFVACAANNTTIQGWDFTLHGGLQLMVANGVQGTTIEANRFAVGANCLAPIRLLGPAGTTRITHNAIDGGGAACGTLGDGLSADVFAGRAASGASVVFEWNEHVNIGEDGINFTGPAEGVMTIRDRFNFIARQGWRGHPDGIQLVRGGFANSVLAHNTYWNPLHAGGVAGTQPFHIEAQLVSSVDHWVVAYNTVVLPGSCHGGRDWPAGCTANYGIACKRDSRGDVNTGFRAYGNYIDASGAIAAILDGSGCSAALWGVPHPNRDMTTGGTLAVRN